MAIYTTTDPLVLDLDIMNPKTNSLDARAADESRVSVRIHKPDNTFVQAIANGVDVEASYSVPEPGKVHIEFKPTIPGVHEAVMFVIAVNGQEAPTSPYAFTVYPSRY